MAYITAQVDSSKINLKGVPRQFLKNIFITNMEIYYYSLYLSMIIIYHHISLQIFRIAEWVQHKAVVRLNLAGGSGICIVV